jgi:hypothetical protein
VFTSAGVYAILLNKMLAGYMGRLSQLAHWRSVKLRMVLADRLNLGRVR